MTQTIFSAGLGVELVSSNFDALTHIITGTGAPGGDAGPQDAAPVGSIYLRQDLGADSLQLYTKIASANALSDWVVLTSKDYVDAVASGLSWREPARVLDNTAYANVGAIPTTGTIDGVALADGDRVLFTNLTAGNNNVYVWDAGGTSWTEDANLATDGDALMIQEGTSADQQWVYDGAAWVQFSGAAANAELGHIRDFIGKDAAGAESPTYSSALVVTQNGTLEAAIGELDAGIGDLQFTNDFVVTDGASVTANLDAIDTAFGDRQYTENNVIADGESVTDSLEKIDVAIGDLTPTVANFAGVTALTVLDTVPLADADNVQWKVVAENAGDATNRISATVDALHNGTVVDSSQYAVNRIGPVIAGLTVTVAINGANLELRAVSSTAVDIGVRRLSEIAAN